MYIFTILGLIVAAYLVLGGIFTMLLAATNYEGVRDDFKKEPHAIPVIILIWPYVLATMVRS